MQLPRSERELFTDVLHTEVTTLQATFPALAEALSRAHALVAGGAVFVEENGREAMVRSSQGTTFYHVNGHCPCPASQRHTDPCKHRLAFRLYQRVCDRLADDDTEHWTVNLDLDTNDAEPEAAPSGIDPRFLTFLHGRPFVKYAGLLATAHAAGLVQLTARIEFHTDALVLASATATFQDGRVFTEWADATPENVGFQVRPHWIRMALTRAKARCLRDALNIGICAVEEVSE